MENLIWALIVVTGTANVNVSTGYPNKTLCEDAISIAKTGLTVAEKKADDDRIRLQQIRQDQEWEDAHPPREPTAEDRKKCNDNSGNSISFGPSTCAIEKDGLVHQVRLSRYVSMANGYYDPAREIKYAKCVMINPNEK